MTGWKCIAEALSSRPEREHRRSRDYPEKGSNLTMKTERITRLIRLVTTLQAGKGYSVDELAGMFDTSRRTIFRDLRQLEQAGVPCQYDAGTKGYVIPPQFFLPPVDLNLQEALSLLLLAHEARKNVQLPFANSALLAALKVENNLPLRIRQYCNTALKTITTRAAAQAPAQALDRVFAQLQTAILTKRKVKIRYGSLFEGRIIDVELYPYHLFYNQRAWYVVGYSCLHNSIRTFKLGRMQQLEPTGTCFVNQQNFDLEEYLGRAWSMIPEGRLYDVKLRFLPKVAANVIEVRWHSTQSATLQPDGSAIVEFRVDGLGEITWWILGYGDQVEVLAPKQLRTKIRQMAENMVTLNQPE